MTCIGLVEAGPAFAAGDQTGIVTWQAFFQQLLSAVRIDTAQSSVTAQQVSSATLKSSEAKTSAILQSRQNMRLADAKSRYAYETGQGYNSCMVSVGKADIARARQEREQFGRKVGARDSKWLSEGGGDATDTLSSLIALRKGVYCSDQEKQALGAYCQPEHNGYDAGNSDASVWLATRSYGAEEAMTGMDYVDTVAPLPTIPQKGAVRTDQALQRANAIRAGMMRNAARTTLQNIILDGMSGTSAKE